jgi:hypothetical protein
MGATPRSGRGLGQAATEFQQQSELGWQGRRATQPDGAGWERTGGPAWVGGQA